MAYNQPSTAHFHAPGHYCPHPACSGAGYPSSAPSPMSSHSGHPSPYIGSSAQPLPPTQHHGAHYASSSDPFGRPMMLPPMPLHQQVTTAPFQAPPPPARHSYPSASMSTHQQPPPRRSASTDPQFGVFSATGSMHVSGNHWVEAERLAKDSQKMTNSRENRYCQECEREFDKPSTYQTHMNRHTGAKPFKCSICGQAFGVGSNRLRHERQCEARKAAYDKMSTGEFTAGPAPGP